MQTTDASNFFRAESALAREEARSVKAERTKNLGSPVVLPGKVLNMKVRGSEAWTAESGHVVRRVSLESGKTLQLFQGHAGPATCLTFYEKDILLTGSWDKTIKAWGIADRSLLSSTPAHDDFVKALLVIPSLSLLVSGSSDTAVRFWDLASDLGKPLSQLGSIAAHTRPVQALAFELKNDASAMLYTGDTMGVMKVWRLEREYGASPRCRGVLIAELQSHRTGVNDLWVGMGYVWSASNDGSVLIQPTSLSSSANAKAPLRTKTISHTNAVKALLPLAFTSLEEPLLISASGEVIRVYSYDMTASDDSPELLGEIDVHWDDVTALGIWMRVVEEEGKKHLEPWILSAGLDATLRRWRLKDILNPEYVKSLQLPQVASQSSLTEEEERELEELLDTD